jgi:hypothetical protein
VPKIINDRGASFVIGFDNGPEFIFQPLNEFVSQKMAIGYVPPASYGLAVSSNAPTIETGTDA